MSHLSAHGTKQYCLDINGINPSTEIDCPQMQVFMLCIGIIDHI